MNQQAVTTCVGNCELSIIEQIIPMLIVILVMAFVCLLQLKIRLIIALVVMVWGFLLFDSWDMSSMTNFLFAGTLFMSGFLILFRWANKPRDENETRGAFRR